MIDCYNHRTHLLVFGLQHLVDAIAFQLFGSDFSDSNCQHPVISLMPDQHELTDMGGTMRLGAYPARLLPGSKAYAAYGADTISERHRHRWEFNNAYREVLGGAGLVLSG